MSNNSISNNYIALLAEGASERAILDLLLDYNKLIFTRESLLEEEVIRTRKAKTFQRSYLNHDIDKLVKIYRVHDSKNERFKLDAAFLNKIKNPVEEIYTTPEIEILFIIHKGDFNKYKNIRSSSKIKPSIFVKKNYKGFSACKNYQFVYDYWDPIIDELIYCIKKYAQYSGDPSSNTLACLIK